MVTLERLVNWLQSKENENLEFKEAKNNFDINKLLKYLVALANENGGYLILGVSDKLPHQVVGTQVFSDINDIKKRILDKLDCRIEISEILHSQGRVLVFEMPSRPIGRPLQFDGAYLMRVGESLVPMTPDHLKRIFSENESDWLIQPAKTDVTAEEVISLLDTQTFFDLLNMSYPSTREAVLERLTSERLIETKNGRWVIFNLAAILFAKHLDAFSQQLARKAVRIIIYKGNNKLETQEDKIEKRGYAVGFENLVEFVYSIAPLNYFIEQQIRQETKMFPKQALRELIANALVHQDFLITGASVMIEMYNDRIEISNPGIPPIKVERFIDEYRSRNELLADLMRRLHICEEKGSGIDKVVRAAEVYQLPAPDFRTAETRTTTILFSYQDFSKMSKSDRIRACYQHCCLLYVSNQRMSNQTLRERFKLPEFKAATVSLIINATKEANLIKQDETDSSSTRYARYLPFWA